MKGKWTVPICTCGDSSLYTDLIISEEGMSEHSNSKYVDREIKFVLENLDISSLSLLPGHAYIHNITDIDITAPAGSQSTTTAIGTLMHIQMLTGSRQSGHHTSHWGLPFTARTPPNGHLS
ncbi:hypothetical protein DFJ58DRAFT_733676 [Suillus subalutaceus]|uniref:uncharacterized protein n=1 Tax=Suillus subalutaceus TaxID=48586 RepID=UPI001B88439F|nr:uncharacterized protein DFJ58DRAFT_733676 [Suillus subalutaceus]KAG1838731.1 hypothetical protein DFJ58DRAFT_733676 [Suillus subalutaceus]